MDRQYLLVFSEARKIEDTRIKSDITYQQTFYVLNLFPSQTRARQKKINVLETFFLQWKIMKWETETGLKDVWLISVQ